MPKLPEKPPADWMQYLSLPRNGLSEDPDLQREVAEYNRRYLSWDELKYRIRDPERRKRVWGLMKLLRVWRQEHVPHFTLSLTYSLIPDIVQGLHTIDRYLSGTIQIQNRTIRLEQSYIIHSLMEEAIASSVLEGASTTRKVARDMLMKGRKPRTLDERMIFNNYEAMRFILEKKDESLTPGLILEIHRIVTSGTMDEEEVGRFRESNDVVVADPVTGLVYHQPPEYHEIGGLIDELCRFANQDRLKDERAGGDFIHPVIKGIILHFLLGYIHPFTNGNGRTARSIFYWYVLSRGYQLFEYMPISRIILHSKKNYTLAYLHTEYDGMDLTYFLTYHLHCITEALADLFRYLERKQSELTETKAIIQKITEVNQRQAGILREMMEHRDEYFTIRQVMQMYTTAYQTARTDLLSLADLGYLIKRKRGREFIFIYNEESPIGKGGRTKKGMGTHRR